MSISSAFQFPLRRHALEARMRSTPSQSRHPHEQPKSRVSIGHKLGENRKVDSIRDDSSPNMRRSAQHLRVKMAATDCPILSFAVAS